MKYLIPAISVIVLYYLTFSFIAMDLNPKSWGLDARIGYSLITIPTIAILEGMIFYRSQEINEPRPAPTSTTESRSSQLDTRY